MTWVTAELRDHTVLVKRLTGQLTQLRDEISEVKTSLGEGEAGRTQASKQQAGATVTGALAAGATPAGADACRSNAGRSDGCRACRIRRPQGPGR